MNRFGHTLLSAIIILSAVGPLRAQEPEQPAAPPLPPSNDPVVRVLVATNPSSPSAIARLINTLIDLKQPAYAGPFVQKLIDLNLDDDQTAALYKEVGSAFFLKIAAQRELQPRGKELAAKVIDSVTARARDPQRLAELIEKLADPSLGVRRAALVDLQFGRDAAVQALLAVLVDDNRAELHKPVQDALVIFGSEAFEPLAALVRDGSDAIQQRAIDALARLDHPDAMIYALEPAFSPKSPPQLKAAAQKILATHGELTITQAAAKMYSFARDYYIGRRSIAGDEQGMAAIWRWDANAGQLSLTKMPVQAAIYDQAMRFARDARLLLPDSIELRRLYLGALIEGSLADPQSAGALPAAVQQQVAADGVEAMLDLIDDALKTDHPRVAAATLRTIGDVATADVLRTTDGRPGIVARLLRNPHREVRFAALETIAKLAPADTFPGASFVAESVDFFIRTQGMPKALVADPRELNVSALAGLVAQLGYRPVAVRDARAAVRTAVESGDIELIVVDILLAAPTSGHLLSSLRRDARTAGVPIVIVTSEPDDTPRGEALARQANLAATFPASGDMAALKSAAVEAGMVDTPADVRLIQARMALNWLAALDIAARQRYAWRQLEPALLLALEQSELSALAARLLGEFGSPAAQTALVDFVDSPSETLELRDAAAKAFAASVKQHGILLTSRQMLAQYDRYNASESQPKPVQDLLASILNTLEGVGGKTESTSSVQPPQSEGERE